METTAKNNRGNSNQITRDYLDSLLIELRQLDCRVPDTTCKLFGETFATPVMTAAFSHLTGFHKGGMKEMAKGALAANAVMWYGYGEDQELEEIVSTGAKTVKIVKPFRDRSEIYRKIEHAKKTGVVALGMDIDHGFNQYGEYDINGLMEGISTAELKEFIKASELPFVVKGVLSVHDAVKCADAGAAGIVISHHHGIMDYAAPPLMLLPEIRRAVGNDLKIFVDCGISSGADAFKAIALGADAVSAGRSMLEAFRENGAAGVTESFAQMTKELAGYMAHTAAPTLNDITSDVIIRA